MTKKRSPFATGGLVKQDRQYILGRGWVTQKKVKKRKAPKPRPAPKPIDDIVGLPAGPRVILPFPPVELSPNWRGHWRPKSTATKNYRRDCWALALGAKLKVPEYAGADGLIFIRLDFFPPSLRQLDDDNAPAAFKAGRDGIADALKVDDKRFKTDPHLHTEPRSCVVVTLINPPKGN